MTKAITNVRSYSIEKPAEMSKMATVLKDYILKNKLSSEIKGKNYVNVEGWEFAGFLTGILPKIESVENLSSETEIKWKATVKLYRGDEVIGTGIALCSNKEATKKTFDEYAVLSMAQTRAIGKAYRNLMGWVIKLAGYETTPAEEVIINKDPKMYEEAVKMIGTAKTESNLMTIKDRVDKTKKFNDEQKKELNDLISRRIDVLENEK